MSRQTMLVAGLGVLLLLAGWWLLLLSPAREDLAQVETEIAAAEAETANLRGRVARLEAVRAAAPETEAAIAGLRAIVPADAALPSFQRQLEAAAGDAGVDVTSVATSRPSPVENDATGLHTIAVALNVEGSYFQIVDFLRRIEDPEITSCGLTFDVISMAPAEYPKLSAALSGTMYAVLDAVPQPVDPTAVPAEAPDAAEGSEESP